MYAELQTFDRLYHSFQHVIQVQIIKLITKAGVHGY